MKNIFVCQNCGYQTSKWMGQCPECLSWGTLEEETVQVEKKAETAKKFSIKSGMTKPLKLNEVEVSKMDRISSGLSEFDRVLGGSEQQGFVRGQIVLLGGEPGIGKSTIALELVSKAVSQNIKPLYVSGEESAAQILIRAKRMLGDDAAILSRIEILNEYNVEKMLFVLEQGGYNMVVVDSVQTIFSEESASMSGTVSQIKLSVSKLVNFAKNNDIILILIGQITKEGALAGPKLLEHMVDTVMYMEGEPDTGLRILKAAKNRFGSANEIGIFEMTEKGLMDVSNYALLFMDEVTDSEIGVCKSVVLEGNRFFLVQVQALVDPTPFGLPKRVAEGITVSRLQRICAIVSKYLKVNLRNCDVYVKIAGGMKFDDPALDLSIAIAIMSSLKVKSIESKMVAFGEVNLTGKVSKILRMKERINEAKRLGYDQYINNTSLGHISQLGGLLK